MNKVISTILMGAFVLTMMAGVMARGHAEQAEQTDPRLDKPMVETLQALVRLREAQMQVMSADYEARLETAMTWIKEAQAKVPVTTGQK